MKCVVEYMFKEGTCAYTDSPMRAPFPTVDHAISFIKDMKAAFKNPLNGFTLILKLNKINF